MGDLLEGEGVRLGAPFEGEGARVGASFEGEDPGSEPNLEGKDVRLRILPAAERESTVGVLRGEGPESEVLLKA